MKLSILTMLTNPDERQEKWREALANYCRLADEVIVVDGSITGPLLEFPDPKVKFIGQAWPDDWKWQQLPHQLNLGKKYCTGDWILKLDIDQLVNAGEWEKMKWYIENCEPEVDVLRLIKINYVVNRRYYSKGSQPILFKNKPDIGFGFIKEFPTGDLCMPMRITGMGDDGVPTGELLRADATEVHYWNFSYTFKHEAVARAGYWRMVRAFREYYQNDALGKDEQSSFDSFIQATLAKQSRTTDTAELTELPEEIRDAIKNLTPEQKAHSLWGHIKI